MSNLIKDVDLECDASQPCEVIERLIQPRAKELGGFWVRRLLPNYHRRMVGPWIFFDHMGPADFAPGQGVNVRPHPHINLATVTYLFEGEILHRDSLGSCQSIRPGDINLMVAGRGIVHSERERPEVTAAAHRVHGLQLWLALPEEDEEVEPAFHHYSSAVIPALIVEGVPVRVMMGSAYGATSPVKVFAKTLYVEAHLQAGQSIELPSAEERAVYAVSGNLNLGGSPLPEHSMAVLSSADALRLTAAEESRICVLGGERLGQRYIEWNFVSSRGSRIQTAKEEWRAGRFPKVPGDEEEFIPLPQVRMEDCLQHSVISFDFDAATCGSNGTVEPGTGAPRKTCGVLNDCARHKSSRRFMDLT